MKIGFALVGLSACAVIPAAAQRASEVHHWALPHGRLLVLEGGHHIFLDQRDAVVRG